jgi:hypothetical protein
MASNTASSEITPQHELLINLEKWSNHWLAMGRRGDIIDVACSVIAVAGGFLAAVLAAANRAPWLIASSAAIPALATSLQQRVDFRGRAAWYFLKSAGYQALFLKFKYGGKSAQDAANELAELEVSMEQQWSKFVRTARPTSK